MCSSNLWAVTQTLAGPAASGKWTGLQNAFGNLAGVVAPYLTGLIVNETHSFLLAFVAVAVASAGGGLSFMLIVGKLEPIKWKVRSIG
jgi:cyanate permease